MTEEALDPPPLPPPPALALTPPPKPKRGRRACAVLFHDPKEVNGWLSNWSPHPVEINHTKYDTLETYLMHRKALLFGDAQMAEAILRAGTPWKAKCLGRRVRGFVEARWVAEREAIILEGVRAKVAQHPELRSMLRVTETVPIGEASPTDLVWGIGHDAKSASPDPAKWRGLNLLGKTWMRVRDELANSSG